MTLLTYVDTFHHSISWWHQLIHKLNKSYAHWANVKSGITGNIPFLWLKVSKLSLNVKNTQYMLFTNKRSYKPNICVNINVHPIDEVQYTRFLGICIDNKFNWKKHIAYISRKVSRGIGIILKLRESCTFYSQILFFNYCFHVWGKAYGTNVYPLVVLQKQIVRIITFSKYLDHYGPSFKELCLLKIGEINKHLSVKYIYRCYNSQVPLLFLDMFQYIRIIHGYGIR